MKWFCFSKSTVTQICWCVATFHAWSLISCPLFIFDKSRAKIVNIFCFGASQSVLRSSPNLNHNQLGRCRTQKQMVQTTITTTNACHIYCVNRWPNIKTGIHLVIYWSEASARLSKDVSVEWSDFVFQKPQWRECSTFVFPVIAICWCSNTTEMLTPKFPRTYMYVTCSHVVVNLLPIMRRRSANRPKTSPNWADFNPNWTKHNKQCKRIFPSELKLSSKINKLHINCADVKGHTDLEVMLKLRQTTWVYACLFLNSRFFWVILTG